MRSGAGKFASGTRVGFAVALRATRREVLKEGYGRWRSFIAFASGMRPEAKDHALKLRELCTDEEALQAFWWDLEAEQSEPLPREFRPLIGTFVRLADGWVARRLRALEAGETASAASCLDCERTLRLALLVADGLDQQASEAVRRSLKEWEFPNGRASDGST